MTPAELDARYDFARDLVGEAGRMAVAMRNDPAKFEIAAKGPRDMVTAADQAVEKFIVAKLGERFGDAVLGEEFGGDASARVLWIVDPIDGTYNYMRSNPRWCVSLGLLIDGRPELGFLDAPQAYELYEARRGGGAFRNGKRLAVSDALRANSAPLVEIGNSRHTPLPKYFDAQERLMSNGIETRRGGSGALGLAQVATGEIDAYFEHYINSWDVAAAMVLVTEAGGITNDFFASRDYKSGRPIFAASPAIAGRLQSLLDLKL